MVNVISRFWKGYNILGRIFWAATLTMSLYGMGIFSFYTLQRYYSSPVEITVGTEYIHWNIPFPAVSVCLAKGRSVPTQQRVIEKLNISENEAERISLKNLLSCIFAAPYEYDIGTLEKCDNLQSKYGITLEDLKEMFLSNNCEEVFEEIEYNEKIYNCTDVFKFHNTEPGYCFIANSIMDSGHSFENLKLKYNSASKNRILSMKLRHSNLWRYGVNVHSPEELPFHDSKFNFVFLNDVMYSYTVDIIKSDSDIVHESIHKRRCRFPHENLYGSPFPYSFASCLGFLQIELELEKCNCTHSTAPEIYRSQYCNLSGIKCLSEEGNIKAKAQELAMEKSLCIPSCTEHIIELIGYSDWKTPTNFTSVSVEIVNFPHVLYHRVIIRGKLDLAVAVAGLAGLFFGVSLINFVEVLYYLVTAK